MSFDPGFLGVFVGSQLTNVAISTPFAGAMVRLRANYVPLQAAAPEGKRRKAVEPKSDAPALTGILSALERTWTLEGIVGIFKGAVASLSASMIVSFGSALAALLAPSLGADPEAGIIGNLIGRLNLTPNVALAVGLTGTIAVGLPLIPFSVLVSRAVVTPYSLPFSLESAKALMSPEERERPWLLYAPGLITNFVLQTLTPIVVSTFTVPLLYAVAAAASPSAAQYDALPPQYFGAVFVGLNAAAAAWMVPLSVVAEKISVAYTPDASVQALPRASESGDVVNFRTGPRYTGLLDAISTIRAEEGTGALYRGWFWSAAALALPAIGQVMAVAQAGRTAVM